MRVLPSGAVSGWGFPAIVAVLVHVNSVRTPVVPEIYGSHIAGVEVFHQPRRVSALWVEWAARGRQRLALEWPAGQQAAYPVVEIALVLLCSLGPRGWR